MKPLTDQQRLQLVESEQIYDAWRQAHWRRHDYRYGMRWKKVRNYEYLIRLTDGRGNGRSLGRRDTATEQLYASFNKGKAAAEDIWRGLSERIEQTLAQSQPIKYQRYMDDYLIFAKSRWAAREVYEKPSSQCTACWQH